MADQILSTYEQFLRQKIKLASFDGFDVDLSAINPALKPHTRDIVKWAIKKGRRVAGSELSTAYFKDQVHYLQAAERGFFMPSLFDLEESEQLREAA